MIARSQALRHKVAWFYTMAAPNSGVIGRPTRRRLVRRVSYEGEKNLPDAPATPATWRIVLAAILDFFTAFFVFGFVIAWATNGMTPAGFSLSGLPALLLFAAIVAYFVVGKRVGGTLWKRILGVVR